MGDAAGKSAMAAGDTQTARPGADAGAAAEARSAGSGPGLSRAVLELRGAAGVSPVPGRPSAMAPARAALSRPLAALHRAPASAVLRATPPVRILKSIFWRLKKSENNCNVLSSAVWLLSRFSERSGGSRRGRQAGPHRVGLPAPRRLRLRRPACRAWSHGRGRALAGPDRGRASGEGARRRGLQSGLEGRRENGPGREGPGLSPCPFRMPACAPGLEWTRSGE